MDRSKILELTLIFFDYNAANIIRPFIWQRGLVMRMLVCIVVVYVFVISSISLFLHWNDEMISEYQGRLERMTAEINNIKQQHKILIMAIQKNAGIEVMETMISPSVEYEQTRRRIYENTQDLWYFIRSELQSIIAEDKGINHTDSETVQILQDVAEIKRSLLADQQELAKFDGYAQWRQEESKAVSSLIQRRLDYLQNPENCDLAKKIVCKLDKVCGYACQVHRLVYCLMYAYATARTLVLDPTQPEFIQKWQNILMPIPQKCNLDKNTFLRMLRRQKVSTDAESKSANIIYLPYMEDVQYQSSFQPFTLPEDLADRIIRINGDPTSWWIGQFVKYIFKPTKYLQKNIHSSMVNTDLKNPVVGIHIQDSANMETEALNYKLDEYMQHVEDYYNQLAGPIDIRRVFITPYDPKLYEELAKNFPDYIFVRNLNQATIPETQPVVASVASFVIDVSMLSMCDHVVGTFNSSLGRLAYELMQASRDASNSFQSLDGLYYFGTPGIYLREAVYRHTSEDDDEIEFEAKDRITVHTHSLNGYATGCHVSTDKRGLFPWYKTAEVIETHAYPKYKKVPQ